MAALTRNGNFAKHMLSDCFTFIHQKRCAVVRVGSLIFIARNRACLASTIKTMEVQKNEVKSDMGALESKFGWMRSSVPFFSMNGNNVRVITEPCDFYGTFKSMAEKAKRRIVIASLYLGTGQHEKDLVQSIEEACKQAKQTDDFEVHILLDYTRGSRGGVNSSRTMLTPLLQNYGNKVNVYLYHTPDLRGLLKQYMPERFNETVGLSHMKIYLVDDDVIISGANLSESYFTNRQDRYIQFKQCPAMCDYLSNIIKSMAEFTFHLQHDNSTVYPSSSPHPYEGSDSSSAFKSFAGEIVNKVKNSVIKQQRENTQSENPDHDTWLCPLIQMGPFGICDDEHVTKQLFERTESHDTLYLASGYFNLTTEYMETIIKNSKGRFEILTASPEANGFFGASGISGYVPAAYTGIAQRFYTEMCQHCQEQRIAILEYFRPHWTFHAKGLWYYLPNCDLPAMTFVGSPNFGYRSVLKDLECQVVVMTTNTDLQKQLHQEQKRLYESASEVKAETFQQSDRYVPLWVKFVTKYMKNFF